MRLFEIENLNNIIGSVPQSDSDNLNVLTKSRKIAAPFKAEGFDPNNPKHAWWSTNFNKQKNKAPLKGLSWSITKEYAWDLINNKQHWVCALTGLQMTESPGGRNPNQASLDRIDSKRGYDRGNVQYVTLQINLAKKNMSDSDFIEMCKRVVKHNF